MRTVIKAGAVIAMCACSSMAASETTKPCLTDSEARALFTYAIPEALEGVAGTCSASLPPTAYLPSKSADAIARYRAAASGAWPLARQAFLKIGGADDDGGKLIEKMPDSALQPFVAAALSTYVAQDIKPADCPKIDRLVAALAPLQPPDTAELITALLALVGGTKGSDDLPIC